MPIEQALEELKKYAKDFTAIGDAKDAIKINKDEFMHKWIKVFQYYDYVSKNANMDQFVEAVEIVENIRYNNPSLDSWIDSILNPKQNNKNDTNIDTSALSNKIESYVTEINNMQYWDPNYINEIEWQLQELQKILISNQKAFDTNLYNSLLNDINSSLIKISRFNKMINSEVMESIKTR